MLVCTSVLGALLLSTALSIFENNKPIDELHIIINKFKGFVGHRRSYTFFAIF